MNVHSQARKDEPAQPLPEEAQQRVCVVSPQASRRALLREALRGQGFQVSESPNGFQVLGALEEAPLDVVVADLEMPLMGGLELLERLRARAQAPSVVLVADQSDVETAVQAMRQGASDFFFWSVAREVAPVVLQRTLERRALRSQLVRARARLEVMSRTSLLGGSPLMLDLKRQIEQVASTRATVLITGESGTGKELIARSVHEQSARRRGPFVRLHCAALSESLLESELFGHEKGAFTGAMARRRGRFEEAQGGTLFLDEVGEISASVQVKLLRVLQERQFERVGSGQTLEVDVRIIAATNRNLKQEVRQGRFREDLYFRLNVVHLQAPPLRARREDIPLLVRHFTARYAAENDKPLQEIAPELLGRLSAYGWPGNVRELQNTLERAVIMADGDVLQARHLPLDFGDDPLEVQEQIQVPGSTLAQVERFLILRTYEAMGGNTARTAEALGISVRKVRYKLREYAGVPLDELEPPT